MKLFLLIIIVSLIEYVGDSSFKIYARENKIIPLVIGIMSYLFLIIGLIVILRKTNVIYMNSLWDSVSLIIESLFAIILLHETLSNNFQYIGLYLIIFGTILLNIGKVPY